MFIVRGFWDLGFQAHIIHLIQCIYISSIGGVEEQYCLVTLQNATSGIVLGTIRSVLVVIYQRSLLMVQRRRQPETP